MGCCLFLNFLRVKILLLRSRMSFRNSTASIFRTADYVFCELTANGLGTIKAFIFNGDSGGFSSTSIYVSPSEFSITIAINQSSRLILRK
jgi:hypothetical protein